MTEELTVTMIPRRRLFINEKTFFSIYSCDVIDEDMDKVKTDKLYGNISCQGNYPDLEIGRECKVVLEYLNDEKYPNSYKIVRLDWKLPEKVSEQRAFLSTLLTSLQVENIYRAYNEDTDIINMFLTDTFDYSKVKGIGTATCKNIRDKVVKHIRFHEIIVFLSKYDIPYTTIKMLINKHQDESHLLIKKLKKNPYILTELEGVGFKKADTIAQQLGLEKNNPHRIDSCIWYVINEESKNGHSWIPYKQLINITVEYLDIAKKDIDERLQSGEVHNVVCVDEKYANKHIYEAENYVASSIIGLQLSNKKIFEDDELDRLLDEYQVENNVEFTGEQKQFFHNWNENAVSLLIGNGGSGKSWLQKTLIKLINQKKPELYITLLSPTGRASKVATNYTGLQASTIHRYLGRLDEDVEMLCEEDDNIDSNEIFIIDESSMCDIPLMKQLFSKIENGSKVLFVGDDFQLPSVGVGNFLYDLIHSNVIKVSKLTKVFRQKDGGILDVATNVREGNVFLSPYATGRVKIGQDCVFKLMKDKEQLFVDLITSYVNSVKMYGVENVAVLSPQKGGMFGVHAINQKIQELINPKSPMKKEKSFGKDNITVFRVGDKVMNIANQYDIELDNGNCVDIFNGDEGFIVDVDDDNKQIMVEIDENIVPISYEDVFQKITHSWANTIHKYQGSQIKVVIAIVDASMKYQLNANLLYTGFSRAEKLMLVLGQADTINYAMGKFMNMERRSFLQDLLKKYQEEVAIKLNEYVESCREK